MTKKEKAALDERYARGLAKAKATGKTVPCWAHAIRGCTACSRGGEDGQPMSSRELSQRSRAMAGSAPAVSKEQRREEKRERLGAATGADTCPSCGVRYVGSGTHCGFCGHDLSEAA